MTSVAQLMLSLPMAAALGLFFGLSACALSCLPYLAPVFLATGGGIRDSWRILLPFSLGRLGAYAGLGAAAGAAGHYLGASPAGSAVHWLLSAAAVLIGIDLLLRPLPPSCTASVCRHTTPRPLVPAALVAMGAAMALTPCAPLGTVLFSAALAGSAVRGAALGLCFGLGAIIVPALIYGLCVAYVGERLRELLRDWRGPVERFSGFLLLAAGITSLYG